MTIISSAFYSYHASDDSGTSVNQAGSSWLKDRTVYAGYPGSGHIEAISGGNTDPANNAAHLPIDITAVPTGLTYKVWVQVYAQSGTGDSARMTKSTAPGSYKFFETGPGNKDQWYWMLVPDMELDGTETEINLVTRETAFAIGQVIIVDSTETATPEGSTGFEVAATLNLDTGSAIQAGVATTGNTGEVFLDDISLTGISWTVTSDVTGVVFVKDTVYESGGNTYFPFIFETGAAGTGTITLSITASGNTYPGAILLTVEGNSPPVVTNPGTQNITTAGTLSLAISATDPESEDVTFYWDDYLPPATISMDTGGNITGNFNKSDVGTYTLKIKGVDESDNAGQVSFDVVVTHTDTIPTFDTCGTRIAHVGKQFRLGLVGTADSYMEETPVIAFADAFTEPGDMAIVGDELVWTPLEADVSGSYQVDFKVSLNGSDYAHSTTIEIITATLGGSGNASPITNNKYVATAYGVDLDIDVSGSVTDPEGDTLTYSLNSNGLKGTVYVTDSALGTFEYVPTGEGVDIWTYAVTDGTNSVLGLVQVTIGANPLTAPTISGLAPAGKVAEAYSFTPTTTGSGLTFAIDAIPAGLSFSTSTGELSGDGVSAPTPAGTYSFTITVTNSAGAASKGYTLIIDAADVVTPPVTVTAGNLLAVYFDADNNEQQLQFDVSSFDEIDNENNIVAEADNKANFEVTYLGGRDEYPIKVPDIKPGVVDDYTTFRNAMRIGRSVTITDPNNIRPHIEFPLLARTTKTPVLSDLNRCGSMTLTCTLWRIVS